MLITVVFVVGCAIGAGVGQVMTCGTVSMIGAVSMNSTVSRVWIGPRIASVVTTPGQSCATCVVIGCVAISIGSNT